MWALVRVHGTVQGMQTDEEFERLVAPIRDELRARRSTVVLARTGAVGAAGVVLTIVAGMTHPAIGAVVFLGVVFSMHRALGR